jgi:hypothetical protein
MLTMSADNDRTDLARALGLADPLDTEALGAEPSDSSHMHKRIPQVNAQCEHSVAACEQSVVQLGHEPTQQQHRDTVSRAPRGYAAAHSAAILTYLAALFP